MVLVVYVVARVFVRVYMRIIPSHIIFALYRKIFYYNSRTRKYQFELPKKLKASRSRHALFKESVGSNPDSTKAPSTSVKMDATATKDASAASVQVR